jgi:Sulfotransferase domain
MLRVRGRIDSRLRRSLPRPAYHFLRSRYYEARTLVRRNPGRGHVLPDFLVIGAAKSGTTSLYGWLSDHPSVAPAVTKEVHFFDYDFYRGTDWYRSHFPLEQARADFARDHGRPFLTGEASPSYISHFWAPRRIRRVLPEAKLIALFRNPVDRAYSQFQMSRREGVEELESFEEATAQEENRLRPELARMSADPRYNSWAFGCWSYLARSRYAEQLERWLELFPREQFLFVKAEDLSAEPERTLEGVHDFLGLPGHSHDRLPRLHTAEYEPMPADSRARLAEYFRPHNELLYELVGVDFGWEREAAAVAV